MLMPADLSGRDDDSRGPRIHVSSVWFHSLKSSQCDDGDSLSSFVVCFVMA